MKLLSSCFCISLQTSVKVVCKSLMLMVAITTSINIYHLDYKGPRLESDIALGVVALFLVLLMTSAFTGHSGAYQGGLCKVFLSLVLLSCTIVHWVVVSCVSLTENSLITWKVCLQNRCPETLWTIDFGFRNSSIGNENRSHPSINQISSFEPYIVEAMNGVVNLSARRFTGRNLAETVGTTEEDEFTEMYVSSEAKEYDTAGVKDVFKERKMKPINEKEFDFWEKSIRKEDEIKKKTKKGVPLFVTLISFVVVFVYLIVCAIIICSHSAELYASYKEDFELDDEEEEEEEDSENISREKSKEDV